MELATLTLKKVSENKIETTEKVSVSYTAYFSNDEKMSLSITQDKPFDLIVGEDYVFKLNTEQKKL